MDRLREISIAMIIKQTKHQKKKQINASLLAVFLLHAGNLMAGLNFPNAVNDEKDLYGRLAGLRLIEETLLQNQHVPVLVIGERRTGKTSLMNVVIRRMQESTGSSGRGRFAILAVEPREITSFNSFARSILLRMNAYTRAAGRGAQPGVGSKQNGPVPEIEIIEQFEAFFIELMQRSQQTVFLVCIDEFDEIVRQTRGSELARILGLIINLIERADLPIAFFFTMTSVPDTLKDEFPSTFISMAQVLELRPFEPADLATLVNDVTGSQLFWAQERLDHLFHMCGGHPYFTKLILAHLLSSCPDCGEPAKVTEDMFRDAVNEALNDPRTDYVFENLYKMHFTDHEKELLLLLARRQAPLPGEMLKQVGPAWYAAARRLAKRHYLVDDKGYYFKAAFMGDWLRNWIAFEEECAKYPTLHKTLAVPVEVVVDTTAGQVRVMGVPVRLSAQEFSIMDFLSERAGQLVHREELVERIWETDQGVSDQVIDTAFYRLRKKIGDQGQYIETIPGQGFKLNRAARIPDHTRRHPDAQGGAE